MAELVAPPDVEGMVISYLTSRLDGVHVSTIYPREDSSLAVRVSVTGGEVTGRVVASPRVLVECWASSTVAAQQLAARVYALWTAWEDVYRVEADLPVSHKDVNRMDLSRYQFLATVYTRMVHD